MKKPCTFTRIGRFRFISMMENWNWNRNFYAILAENWKLKPKQQYIWIGFQFLKINKKNNENSVAMVQIFLFKTVGTTSSIYVFHVIEIPEKGYTNVSVLTINKDFYLQKKMFFFVQHWSGEGILKYHLRDNQSAKATKNDVSKQNFRISIFHTIFSFYFNTILS